MVDYNEAIRLNPAYTKAYVNRGGAYFKKKNYTAAIADFTKARDLDPALVDARYNLGQANYFAEIMTRRSRVIPKHCDLRRTALTLICSAG